MSPIPAAGHTDIYMGWRGSGDVSSSFGLKMLEKCARLLLADDPVLN